MSLRRGPAAPINATDWRWKVLEVLVDGDLVTARYTDTGTHTGQFQGIEPTGRRVEALEFAVYRMVGDRIGEMWSSLDVREVVRQLSAGRAMSVDGR